MFTVNQYKIVFKRIWHTDEDGEPLLNGRYDTMCEIYKVNEAMVSPSRTDGIVWNTSPFFVGIAKLHPNDRPDKIIGKKVALQNAIWDGYQEDSRLCLRKPARTAIWKAFWKWVDSWSKQNEKAKI